MSKNAFPDKSTPKVVVKRPAKPVSKVTTKTDSTTATKPAKRQKVSKKADVGKVVKEVVKLKKEKVVRDSFTMPESEYELIAAIKKRCIAKGLAVKKSEILRAAVRELATQSDALILKAVKSLEIIKTGRPPKRHN